ncbi:hypothetical protein BS50DRAFT_27776 [Corynespora cassiicola Philippines]|uniref:Uncharacterized protein n=1 Tax=Corynespora cassiicola Philippines TaxID=1448308 RepID=A0A2T2PB99_CORCC|nr:hypothetical protein BS50DRAFT_27776 [Corynespora cassiicola Philippines]
MQRLLAPSRALIRKGNLQAANSRPPRHTPAGAVPLYRNRVLTMSIPLFPREGSPDFWRGPEGIGKGVIIAVSATALCPMSPFPLHSFGAKCGVRCLPSAHTSPTRFGPLKRLPFSPRYARAPNNGIQRPSSITSHHLQNLLARAVQ